MSEMRIEMRFRGKGLVAVVTQPLLLAQPSLVQFLLREPISPGKEETFRRDRHVMAFIDWNQNLREDRRMSFSPEQRSHLSEIIPD